MTPSRSSGPSGTTPGIFCGHCGHPAEKEAYDGGSTPPSYVHPACAARLELEPPRFCAQCGRRLKVQVSPLGWWARCSRHGLISAPAESDWANSGNPLACFYNE